MRTIEEVKKNQDGAFYDIGLLVFRLFEAMQNATALVTEASELVKANQPKPEEKHEDY